MFRVVSGLETMLPVLSRGILLVLASIERLSESTALTTLQHGICDDTGSDQRYYPTYEPARAADCD